MKGCSAQIGLPDSVYEICTSPGCCPQRRASSCRKIVRSRRYLSPRAAYAACSVASNSEGASNPIPLTASLLMSYIKYSICARLLKIMTAASLCPVSGSPVQPEGKGNSLLHRPIRSRLQCVSDPPPSCGHAHQSRFGCCICTTPPSSANSTLQASSVT